jgi:protein involved in polysaccharide export with SLBB domain
MSPGAYQVSSLATVFSALAKAGGPTETGSFRSVELRRGDRLVRKIDMYDYLLRGDASNDVRAEQGDFVFVPVSQRKVGLIGAVRRTGTFELVESEGLADLLVFGGGLEPTAAAERVQIDRVLPPSQRAPGRERVVIDVGLRNADAIRTTKLEDGDVVRVFSIGETRRNAVTIRGEVTQPGVYEWSPGMSLRNLIDKAQGLLPWAMGDRVRIQSPIANTGRTRLTVIDLTMPGSDTIKLHEFDDISVLDGRRNFPAGTVHVLGSVYAPGTKPFIEEEDLRAAIDRAGGLREEAISIDVARRVPRTQFSDTTSQLFHFPIDSAFRIRSPGMGFVLQRDDRVIVRSAAGFRPQRFVSVDGQFAITGAVAISEGVDRLSTAVARAGGVLPVAYSNSFRLTRGGRQVTINFDRALAGNPSDDVLLQNGDAISIGINPSTVLVTGAVQRSALVPYRRGLSVRDYIELAGGARVNGLVRRTTVDHPDGTASRVRRMALVFESSPEVVPGSVITVPVKPADTGSVTGVLDATLRYVSALGSLAIAYLALTK